MIYCWYQPSYIKLIKRVTRDVDKLVLDITSNVAYTIERVSINKINMRVSRSPYLLVFLNLVFYFLVLFPRLLLLVPLLRLPAAAHGLQGDRVSVF